MSDHYDFGSAQNRRHAIMTASLLAGSVPIASADGIALASAVNVYHVLSEAARGEARLHVRSAGCWESYRHENAALALRFARTARLGWEPDRFDLDIAHHTSRRTF